jgi:hypothetical protein
MSTITDPVDGFTVRAPRATLPRGVVLLMFLVLSLSMWGVIWHTIGMLIN